MSVRTRSSANAESRNSEGANAGIAEDVVTERVNAEGTEAAAANAVERDLAGSEADATPQDPMKTMMSMLKAQQEMINNLLRSSGANVPQKTPNSRA